MNRRGTCSSWAGRRAGQRDLSDLSSASCIPERVCHPVAAEPADELDCVRGLANHSGAEPARHDATTPRQHPGAPALRAFVESRRGRTASGVTLASHAGERHIVVAMAGVETQTAPFATHGPRARRRRGRRNWRLSSIGAAADALEPSRMPAIDQRPPREQGGGRRRRDRLKRVPLTDLLDGGAAAAPPSLRARRPSPGRRHHPERGPAHADAVRHQRAGQVVIGLIPVPTRRSPSPCAWSSHSWAGGRGVARIARQGERSHGHEEDESRPSHGGQPIGGVRSSAGTSSPTACGS